MIGISWLGPPIDVRPLFAPQQAAFTGLLRGLGPAQWARPTICPGWDVKDVAAHVLGDHIGRLSRHRDGHPPPRPRGDETLPAFLDRFNDEWVAAARRISPRLLIEQLQATGDQVAEFWQAADPDALGEAVSWAGPGPAPVWLDAARDFSEYWTHHQQICDATGQAGLMSPGYAGPVIDTFMRALPHTLRHVTAPEGTALQMTVTGPGAGEWACTRDADRWSLHRQSHPKPTARVELDTDTAWRLSTRGITPQQAAERARINGDRHLAAAALQIVSIIWSPPNP
ncbi:MAG: maleylpyruvate isomerase family mycothiol-dependent enzyme [Actinomycetota bacterium]|nr:maleylpyruvate isomerase family mycothiol-dependent enzyme [Actinomycetota bacterium]